MILCCALILTITCELTTSYNFLLNDNYQLSLYTNGSLSTAIADNVTATTLAVKYPHVYYIQNPEDVDSVLQFNLDTGISRTVAQHLLTITGLAADDDTLYTLEMGRYDIDSTARLTAHSLSTSRHKVLWSAPYGTDPRALFLDTVSKKIYFGLANGNIMVYDISKSTIDVLMNHSDMWPTSICVEENVLHMYNSGGYIALNMTNNVTLDTMETGDWGIFQLSGCTICSIENVKEWLDENHSIRQAKSVVSDISDFYFFNLVILQDETDDEIPLESCQDCDLCLAGICLCVFGYDQSGDCLNAPQRFLLVSQIRSLSLVSLPNNHVTPASDHVTSFPDHVTTRLYITPRDWWLSEVVYDPASGTIFWIELESQYLGMSYGNMQPPNSRIMKMGSDMQPRILYQESGRLVDSISVNGGDGMIYWLDARASLIVVAKTSCSVDHCLKSSLVNENIDPKSRHLRVSERARLMVYVTGNNEIITRNLDGSNPRIILSGNLMEIRCIALHADSVYILPASSGWIYRLPLMGGGQEIVFRQILEFIPISVTFLRDELVVASELRRTITKVNFDDDTSTLITDNIRGIKSIAGGYHDTRTLASNSLDTTPTSDVFEDNICDGKCEHLCFKLPFNNYRCGCADGFILDSGSCQEPPTVFLATGNFIQTFQPFPSSGTIEVQNVVFQSQANIVAVDFFYDKNCLVWIDGNLKTISKRYLRGDADVLSGENNSDLVVDGISDPTDISADWISNMVYWSDKSRDCISAVSLENAGFRRIVVGHALSPTSLVVDPPNGKMYWVGWERDVPMIRSAAMDGSDVTTLLTKPGYWPTDITIDYQNGRVVWLDARRSIVISMSGDGTDQKIIVGTSFMGYPISLSVWYGYTYWLDSHRNGVFVAEGSNAFDVTRLVPGPHVTDLVLSHRLKQSGSNSCSLGNGGCSHVCVPVSRDNHVCLCPDGRALKQGVPGQCYALPQELIGVMLNPYLFGVDSSPERLSHQRLHNAVKIAIYYKHQSIYWLDNKRSSIETVHINGTGYRTVFQSTYQATDIKVDWLGSNVYWTEADSKSVKCVTLSGEFDKLIATTQYAPMFLLLDPQRSHLFWMECDESGQGSLYQSTMSGSQSSLLLTTPSCPDSMDIAMETRTLYWNTGSTLYQIQYEEMNAQISSSQLPFPTKQIVWIEENLFVLREPGEDGGVRSEDGLRIDENDEGVVWEDMRVMISVDRLETVMIDVGNSTSFAAFTPLDTGYSDCDVNNGGCTHFCFVEKDGVKCGCPAQQALLPDNKTCTRQDSECVSGEFRCGSGECIAEEFVCTFNPECLDSSDEVGCGWCEEFQFSCGGVCVPSVAVCDGHLDCPDGEDESSAECSQCDRTGHICRGSGVCLPRSMKCDGVADCEGGDDERKCPKQEAECGELEWRCGSDGACIMREWICDQYPDCKGQEDEQNCEACDPVTEFDCGGSQCIDITEKCDGIIQCLHDGKDELDCPKCDVGQRQCDNGQCRASSTWCDHVMDCSDRSDERNCNYTRIPGSGGGGDGSHVTPTLTIIFGTLFMSVVVVGLLYRLKILPRMRSTYKQLTQASNKTVETNVCVTTNTYSELETTVCSSENTSQRRIKSVDPYETLTTSSLNSSLKPLNAQNPYERFGIAPVHSTTDVSVAEGPPPSVASGGYSSGPASSARSLAPSNRSRALSAKSRAFSSKSRALSGRSRATSGARSRAPVSYHVNTNIIWDDHVNSISDYEHGCLSDNLQSEYSVTLPPKSKLPTTPITSDNDD